MGNRISIAKEQVIMTARYLDEKIIHNLAENQDLDISQLQKLAKSDGLEYDLVFSLDFEHQNFVNTDDLWRLKYLTKLEMPNNLLERIEGLETLVHLQSLDLSFNFIKSINNLDNLVNLISLNLTSNEITVLENMDSLKKLTTFLIRHNKIKSFDSIYYLSKFENLSSLAINKNPIVNNEDGKLHVLSVLPHLKILDFSYVTADQINKAFKKFTSREPKKNAHASNDIKEKFKCSFSDIDKVALVDGLANGQGYESFLGEKNYAFLLSFPLVSDIAEEITAIFDEWHDTGHKYYITMQQEKSQFLSMVTKAKQCSLDVIRDEEMKFILFREQIPKKLCLIYQSGSFEDKKDISEFKKECESCLLQTFRSFMNSICFSTDLVDKLCETYSKETSFLNSQYVQKVEKFVTNIMNINETFAMKFQEFYFSITDREIDSSKEIKMKNGKIYEYDTTFLQLIKKKDLITMTFSLSLRIQSTMLNERVNNLKSFLHNDFNQTINEVKEDVFVRQADLARHTVIFFNKQKCIIDNLFSKSNVFKNYLGYR